MNQITYDLLTTICERCGGRCCFYAKPPLTEERTSVLLENGMTSDDILFQNYRKLDCKSTGFCVGYQDGRCTIHHVKPETCVAGPFTFKVSGDMLEIRIRQERICDLARFLNNNPEVYREQYELALQNITSLLKALPPEELSEASKAWRGSTDVVATIPLAEALSSDNMN
ncbi:MAG: YkgJ family cysteine cluster protein [Euryarchaeota archaeon]|nr:YkgJ family cysteine cluster protein [Euryarchaeota archaeon]